MSHDKSTVSPYRKVSTATWTDRKVLNLTPLQPSGQALFLMLMVGPQSTHIPGVQPVGRLAFSEMLGWEAEAFDEAFTEVYREGLAKADWKARLIFVPNAIKHNLPQSPNVVKSWGAMWARVPECDLKTEVWKALHDALSAIGQGFVDAFKYACPLKICDMEQTAGEPTGKPSAKPSEKPTDNQEAVNSKQKVNTPQPPDGGRQRRRKVDGEPEGFAEFWAAYPRKVGKDDARKAFVKRKPDEDLVARMLKAIREQAQSDQWSKDDGKFIPHPSTWLNRGQWGDGEGAEGGEGAAQGDSENRPQWALQAGFENRWEAENERCYAHNAHLFRDGRRMEVSA